MTHCKESVFDEGISGGYSPVHDVDDSQEPYCT
jgi:hypothetical protein